MHGIIVLVGGFLLDCLLGDPHNPWHPICLIGHLISFLEKKISRLDIYSDIHRAFSDFSENALLYFVQPHILGSKMVSSRVADDKNTAENESRRAACEK